MFTGKFGPIGGVAAALALLASCAPRPAPPQPPPPPPPPLPPAQPAPPAPAPLDWQDAPLGEGDWSYRVEGGGSVAAFGSTTPAFVVRCGLTRQVSLTRAGAAGSALTLRTSHGERALAAVGQADGLAATLNAADPLLDAIAFSRGRFAVEAAGVPLLVLPAWPEPARVIEDCRG